MIASVRGRVLVVAGSQAVVEVGGVGLQITVTPAHALALRVGEEATIPTALIVREDELSLFGFADASTREAFELLRGVSGVGPKSAMAVLGTLSVDELALAVAEDDEAAFKPVPGVGPKTAKLIILSLAGKLHPVSPRAAARPASDLASQVLTALVGLGWPERVARTAVDDALAELGTEETPAVPVLLRRAMAMLDPGGGGVRR